MSTLTLMQKDGEGLMNVPSEKVEAFKKDGWTVVDRPPGPAPVVAVPIEPALQKPAEEESTQTPNVDKVVKRPKKG